MGKIPLAIAKKVGCTPWMIKKINQGKQPSLKLAIKIAEAMDSEGPRLVEMIPLLKKAFSIIIRQGIG
jgi:DNA-binding XRE family transcriptional regulator